MELIPLRCTKCGADIGYYDPEAAVVRCDALGCGAAFVVDQGRAFAKLDSMKAAAIANMRATLSLYLKKKDFAQVSGVTSSILELVPEDFLARFYLHLAGKYQSDPREYRAFIASPGEATQEEYEEAFGVILSCLEPVEMDNARGFIHRANVPAQTREQWEKRLNAKYQYLMSRAGDFENYPRDVFISYCSSSQSLTEKLLGALEKDGVSCWAAYRNLDNTTNLSYWDRIGYAIGHCKVFLLVTTQDAMLSKDVQREMDLAEAQRGVKRLEWKADDTPHTTKFKWFFDGVSWIDGQADEEKALENLRARVYDLMNAEKIEGEKRKRLEEQERLEEQKKRKEAKKSRPVVSVKPGNDGSNAPSQLAAWTLLALTGVTVLCYLNPGMGYPPKVVSGGAKVLMGVCAYLLCTMSRRTAARRLLTALGALVLMGVSFSSRARSFISSESPGCITVNLILGAAMLLLATVAYAAVRAVRFRGRNQAETPPPPMPGVMLACVVGAEALAFFAERALFYPFRAGVDDWLTLLPLSLLGAALCCRLDAKSAELFLIDDKQKKRLGWLAALAGLGTALLLLMIASTVASFLWNALGWSLKVRFDFPLPLAFLACLIGLLAARRGRVGCLVGAALYLVCFNGGVIFYCVYATKLVAQYMSYLAVADVLLGLLYWRAFRLIFRAGTGETGTAGTGTGETGTIGASPLRP